ncbi:glycosyltransferase [Cumulibacter manganitolerans]|uniref:glycosyltransferase n=1 Tax=Cumulibacter manganitolerans TaxID=1884992 RepID=UPI001E5BFCD8|nr:glycosyltransferase [Cumulibacter manganitolerans]
MKSRPLRIAYVSLHTSPTDDPGTGDAGGMNIVELNQAVALGRLGHRVDLITRRADPASPATSHLAPGVALRLLDAGPPHAMAKSAQEAVIGEFAAELATLEPYDVVVSQHWMSGIAALPVARTWGVPHAQSYHSIAAPVGADLAEGEPPESPGREPGERRLARESDAIIAISEAEASTVRTRLGAPPEKVHIVPPGVDHDIFRPVRERRHHRYIAFAARLQPLKAPDLAIRALAEVAPEHRPELWIAGDVSQDFADYRGSLSTLVSRLGLGGAVHFIGSFDRMGLARFFAEAALTVVPSYSETFGLVALESAACGTPVIASGSGGLRESVADGRSGTLLATRDPQAWGAEIERLLTDRAAYEALVAGAIEHAAHFDWEHSADGVERVLRSLVERR